MQVDDLKFNLLDKLISIKDEQLLNEINELIGEVDLEQTIVKLSDAQKNMLVKSEEDIQNGNFISDEELNDEEEKWLKE